MRGALDLICVPLARSARAFVDSEAWAEFGYARLSDHARERFGRSARWVQDLAALGRMFSSLPGLEAAVTGADAGRALGRVAGLLVGRAVTAGAPSRLESMSPFTGGRPVSEGPPPRVAAMGPSLTGRTVTGDAAPSLDAMDPSLIGRVAPESPLEKWLALAREVSVRELRDAVAAARRAGSASPVAESTPGEASDTEGADEASQEAAAPGASDDDEDGTLVRLPVPHPVAAAFDEVLDLFRAVEGHEAGMTSFVEALVADAASSGSLPDADEPVDREPPTHSGDVAPSGGSGGCLDPEADRHGVPGMGDAPGMAPAMSLQDPDDPGGRRESRPQRDVTARAASMVVPDPERIGWREPLRHGKVVAAAERAHARATDRWARLPEAGSSAWALSLAGSSLERLRDLAAHAGVGGAADLDAQIRALVSLEDEIERRLGDILRMMAHEGAWFRLGFDSAVHYAEQRLGLRRSAARMRLRVARALGGLPLLKRAYEEGAFGMEAAYLASRLIGKGGAGESLQRAWVVRAGEATVKRLRDEVRLAGRRAAGLAEAASVAPGREPADAPASHESQETQPVDDATWHASLRREPGTARRRVAAMGRLAAEWRGSDVFLRLRLPDQLATDLLSAAEGARDRLAKVVAGIPWDEPWPAPDPPGSLRAAREFFVRCRRTPVWVGLLALLEEAADTWDPVSSASRRSGESIFRAHGWRCCAPGCTSRKNLEEHHVRYKSHGGGDEEWNRLPACGFHHKRGEHGGLARVRGRAPLGLVWSLGRNRCGGTYRNERRIGADTAR